MKAQTTQADTEQNADLPASTMGNVAGEVRLDTSIASSATGEEAMPDAKRLTQMDVQVDGPTAPFEASVEGAQSGAASVAEPRAVRTARPRANLATRLVSAIPNIGIDDRAGRAILSVLLAFLLWFYVVSLENPSQTTVFNNLQVDVRSLGTNLKLVNPVSPVNVTVQAPQTALGFLRPADVRPYVNLTGLQAGVHTVPIQADVRNTQGGSLSVAVNPGSVQVQLEVEASREVPIEVSVTGTPAFGYGYDAAQVEPTSVRVTGAEDAITRIARVVANVNVDERAGTLQGSRQPVAVDEAGNEISGLTFEPAQVQVVVPIKLGVTYRAVGVRADTRGQPAPGYRVSAITTDPNTVTICCSPTVLSDTQFLDTLPISISDATFDVITRTEVVLPPNVTLYPGQSKTISVTVSVEPLVTTLQVSVAPIVEGQPEGASVVVSPDRLDLTLAGTFDQLQDLRPTDVRAFLSVEGRGPGTYDIRPQVTVPQGVKLERSSPETVTVTIIAPTPVPTNSPTPAPTSTPEPTATIEPTAPPGATTTTEAVPASPSPAPRPTETTEPLIP